MAEKHKMHGVLVGVLVCEDHGHPFIGVQIGSKKAVLSPQQAMLLLEQLGMVLETIGMFDDEDHEPEKKYATH